MFFHGVNKFPIDIFELRADFRSFGCKTIDGLKECKAVMSMMCCCGFLQQGLDTFTTNLFGAVTMCSGKGLKATGVEPCMKDVVRSMLCQCRELASMAPLVCVIPWSVGGCDVSSAEMCAGHQCLVQRARLVQARFLVQVFHQVGCQLLVKGHPLFRLMGPHMSTAKSDGLGYLALVSFPKRYPTGRTAAYKRWYVHRGMCWQEW